MTAQPPDPDPAKTPGLEPGGGVPPGATPPDSAQTSGLSEPEPRPRRRVTTATVVSLVAIVLFVLLFVTIAVVLLLNMKIDRPLRRQPTRLPRIRPTSDRPTTSGDDAHQIRRHAIGAYRRHRHGRVGGFDHLSVADEERDALAALGTVEDQVAGQRLRWQHLLADLVLLARGPRHLDPCTRECIDHQTGRVEPHPADPLFSDRAGNWGEAQAGGTRVG